MKKTIKTITGVMTAALTFASLSTSVMAWGPERPTFTNSSPADYPVFNSITDNIVLGDERDFVRVVELVNEGEELNHYVDELEIEPGISKSAFILPSDSVAVWKRTT